MSRQTRTSRCEFRAQKTAQNDEPMKMHGNVDTCALSIGSNMPETAKPMIYHLILRILILQEARKFVSSAV